jgi:hypothetical protein
VGWILVDNDDGRLIGTEPTWQALAEMLLALLNDQALRRTDFACHAAVVAGATGVAVLPGRSGHGKTTLAAACLLAGLEYLSDESAAFTGEGLVAAYPRPLALDRPGQAHLRLGGAPLLAGPTDVWFRAGDLGAVAGSTVHRRVTHVVLPERRPGDAQLRSQPARHGAEAMLRTGFNHYLDPSRAFTLTTELAAATEVMHLGYESAPEAAGLLVELLSS